ncbi:HAMP domain-containing histidine kinase [Paracoccus caeni]|uniref:histidine kinase n=1 Tax=Paracoccus caeni TaxID=657651 RepID=A0A934SH24_9RHOB|nr:HAMP domain-containing sensor histidine kinase [Paracoccus caeni]MBK4217722.1 HAMP domain-containing histidine kinase [Paracoccus caeni]
MRRSGPILAVLTICSFVVLLGYSLFQLVQINQELRNDLAESNVWAATQAEREAQALLLALHDMELHRSTIDDVQLQFEILYSRIDLLIDLPKLNYFHEFDVTPLLSKVAADMVEMDHIIFADDPDTAAIVGQSTRLTQMLKNLRQLSFSTATGERADRLERRERQVSVVQLLLLGAVGAFLSGVIMAALLWRNMRRAIRTQDELAQHRDSLESTISIRTRELRDALSTERKAKEVYKSFIVTVAHQFRTPVSIIHMIAQRQLRTEDDSLTERLRTKFSRIFEAAVRLDRILDNFLVAANAEGKDITLARRQVDIQHLVASAVEQARLAYPDRNFVLDASDQIIEAEADPILLEQVFINILSNAVKYSDAPSVITVSLRKEDGQVLCSISDEGMGIPEGAGSSIFEPYFRASNAHHFPGIGVGLSLARDIVDMHGGSIDCVSEESKGSRFTISFPASREKLNAPAADFRNDPLRRGRTVPSR